MRCGVHYSDDVAKATQTNLSLGGRRLLTVVADRKSLKQKPAACSTGGAVAADGECT